jgi:dTDP-glucose 4,6-dehydratase
MRILITGGAGFIGSHLCERFIARGDQVICVDNFLTGQESSIRAVSSHPNFILIRHDISQPLSIAEPIDYVCHFASPASPPDYLKHPIETLKVGSAGTLNVLELARAKSAKFLLASTSEVYGDPQVHPQPESYFGHVNPIGPRGCYDEAKRFAEALTMAYHRTCNLDTRIARIFNCYGERMRENDGRAIPNFITQALTAKPLTIYGDGSQTRSFCYIDDLVEGIVRLMESDLHEPVNLGNDEEKGLLDLARMILRLTGSKSTMLFQPLPTDDPKVRRPDLTLAKERLHWRPNISLEKGLAKTIDWFKSILSSV